MKRRGFTLIELLVVIAIIGVLISLLVPSITHVQESSRSVACRSNLRQVAIAGRMYILDADGQLPDWMEWCSADPQYAQYSLPISYLGLPPATYDHHSNPPPEVQFATVLTCPTTLRFPDLSLQSYHRTFALSTAVSGSAQRDRSIYAQRAEAWRFPRHESQIKSASEAGFFFDGINTGLLSRGWFIRWYAHWDKFLPHFRGRETERYYHVKNYAVYRDEDLHNVAFLDGHVQSMERLEMEERAERWRTQGRSDFFWPALGQ